MTSPLEIVQLAKRVHVTSSEVLDEISPKIDKSSIEVISTPLADNIVKCSVAYGIVWNGLKITKAIPILKYADKRTLGNYKPLLALPYSSKKKKQYKNYGIFNNE